MQILHARKTGRLARADPSLGKRSQHFRGRLSLNGLATLGCIGHYPARLVKRPLLVNRPQDPLLDFWNGNGTSDAGCFASPPNTLKVSGPTAGGLSACATPASRLTRASTRARCRPRSPRPSRLGSSDGRRVCKLHRALDSARPLLKAGETPLTSAFRASRSALPVALG